MPHKANQLQQIADMLLINGALLESSGLWYGKMGVAVFFFHYAQYTGNELFEDYAVEIIQAIQADIHRDSITDYDRGLAGIGTGIEYLSQNGFLEIDADEVLEDFDNRIRKEIMYHQQENNSLGNGLCGLGRYLQYRTGNSHVETNDIKTLTNCESMVHVVNILENEAQPQNCDLPDILSFLCSLLRLNICNPKIERYIGKILNDDRFINISAEDQSSWTLALLCLSPLYGRMADLANQYINVELQVREQTGKPSAKDMDTTDTLLWLLHCKRLIGRTGICFEWTDRVEALIRKKLSETDGWLRYEKSKLSLRGCAGAGLAMMTLAGTCNDNWLDLLGLQV